MSLKTIIGILPILGVMVMVLWGVLGNAWNISWIAVFVGGCLMGILGIILGAQKENDKNEKK